jgi:hypothetical protein
MNLFEKEEYECFGAREEEHDEVEDGAEIEVDESEDDALEAIEEERKKDEAFIVPDEVSVLDGEAGHDVLDDVVEVRKPILIFTRLPDTKIRHAVSQTHAREEAAQGEKSFRHRNIVKVIP